MSESPTKVSEEVENQDRIAQLRQFVKDAVGKEAFDDRVDVRTDISTLEVLSIMRRSLGYLADVKGLFLAKLLLYLGMVLPLLMLPWIGKLVIDGAVLGNPIHATEVNYPPFMNPVLALLEGKDPLGIMLTISVIYLTLFLIMGGRFGNGTYAGLLAGQDAATQSENQLSAGGSRVGGLWGMLEFMVHVRFTQRLGHRIRTRLFQRLTRLPMPVLDDQRIGDSIYRVLYDVPMGPDLIFQLSLLPMFMAVLAVANLFVLEYSYGQVAPELIWIGWATVPMAFLITYPFSGPLRRSSQNKRSAGSATTNTMEESLSNVAAVQSLGAEEVEKDRFAKRSAESFRRERLSQAVVFMAALTFAAVAGIASIYVTILVSDRIIDEEMSIGDFSVLLGAYAAIASSAGYFGAYWIKIQDVIAAIRRVYFFMDFETEEDHPGSKAIDNIESGFIFENVSFQYSEDEPVLQSVDTRFDVGEMVAIVGPTGAGKTTMAYLIPRFLSPTEGRVLVDSVPIEEIEVASLRSQVTYVFQEHLLLSETIRANLLFANPDATEPQMIEALKRAAVWDFIETLPEGLDTRLGRSGDTLSVGQQQRISIARGLVRNTPVLILDEPTAALDPQTERALVNVIKHETKNRLVVVIAHRLSTIRQADKIVFLDNGHLKGVGNHDELMKDASSPYREFVELQTG